MLCMITIMPDSALPDAKPSELESVVAHLLVMRGLYKAAQLHYKAGIWHIKNQGEQEIFIISAEQNPKAILEFIQTEQISHFTAYHFCQSEIAIEQMSLVYSRNRSVAFKKFFLMRKTLHSDLNQSTSHSILRKHFDAQAAVASNSQFFELPTQKMGSYLYAILENKKMLSWARNSQGADGSSWVSDVNTQLKARKQGLATAIMQRIHSDAAAVGNTHVFLGVHPENIRFYEKMGYEITMHGIRATHKSSIWQRLLARAKRFLKR